MTQKKEPYSQRSSIIYKAFQLCLKGTTEKKLIALVNSMKGDPGRVLKAMKRGYGSGFIWDVEEHSGHIKIMRVRLAPKI